MESDTASGSIDNTDEVIDDAISEFMASEGTERVNRGLRNLYGMQTDKPSNAKKLSKDRSKSESELQPRALNREEKLSSVQTKQHFKGKRTKKEAAQEGSRKKIRNQRSEAKAAEKEALSEDPSKGMVSTASKSFLTAPKKLRYSDLGGLEDVLSEIKELVEYPLKHPEVYHWLGIEPPRGVLLHGPPGCGKTALAHAIAYECQVPFFKISAPEIVSGISGQHRSCRNDRCFGSC